MSACAPIQRESLSEGSNTASETHDEDNPPDDDEKEANVEHHIKDGLQLESLSTAPLVKGSIDSNPDQKKTREPKQEIEEEQEPTNSMGHRITSRT